MIAANRYEIDVDDVLSRFEMNIHSFVKLPSVADMYTQQVIPDYFASFGFEMTHYYLHRGKYIDGFKFLMNAMVKSHIINNETYFINCIGLFMRFQVYAAPAIQTEFSNLIEKVWLSNVKKNNTVNHFE